MFKPIASSRKFRQGLALVCIIAGTAIASTAAFAGECPADKMKADVRAMVDTKGTGVSDVTLGGINREKQPAHTEARELLFRKLTIEPESVVPSHSHDDRHALIFVQQ